MEGREKKKIGTQVLAAGEAVCLVGNLGIGAFQVYESQKNNAKVNKFINQQMEWQAKQEEKENTYQEDGFKVADTYEIRSTKAISDAYLRGDDSQLGEKDKETLKMAKEILEKITKDCKNDYEKELAVYDWMYENLSDNSGARIVMPSGGADDYTPYGVLSGKNAVCVGYATTFRLFMNMLGLECHVVHNDYHSWNLVQLDDGQWYHTDIYSDATSGSRYGNFNMTDEVALRGHEWDSSCLPEAKGVTYAYSVQNAEKIEDVYDLPKMIQKALEQKKPGVFCRWDGKPAEEEIQVVEAMITQVSNVLLTSTDFLDGDVSAYWCEDEDGKYVLSVYFSYYNKTENTTDLDKKTEKKVEKAIEEAFGVDVGDLSYGDQYYED